ncbi:MAG TPA: hypothetical protein VHW65_13145 [Gemmatimonadales bacterium]|nr:hypothetical protein [Gemmatimonadales bacterium]
MLDSLLAGFAGDTSAVQLPASTTCAARNAMLGVLCDGLIGIRRAELGRSRKDAERARSAIIGVLNQHPDWPVAWYALGVARLASDELGAGPDGGPLETDHADNAAGAERALIRALGFDSTFVLAAEALALAPIVHDSTSQLYDRVTTLRKVRHLLPPPYLFAAALVEREADHLDSAIAIEVTLLRTRAVPRGLVDVTVAGDLFKTDNPTLANQVYYAGADDPTPVSRNAYRRNILAIASPAELAAWDSLAAAQRPAWLRQFWGVRDVRDGRPDGARLAEQFQRLQEAEAMYRFRYVPARNDPPLPLHGDIAYFTTEVPGVRQPFSSIGSFDDVLDDRGRIYLRQGVPLLSMRTGDDAGYELWEYDRAGEKLYATFSPQFVPPVKVIGTWKVDLLKKLSDPIGWVLPASLVPTLDPLDASIYGYRQEYFCALKQSLCHAFVDSSKYTTPRINCTPAVERPRLDWRLGDGRFMYRGDVHLTPEDIAIIDTFRLRRPPLDELYLHEREREEGWWEIDQATTTDAFPVPFSRQITAAFEAHALRKSDSTTHLAVAFAIPGKELPPPQIDFERGVVTFPLHVHVAALNRRTGVRYDVDTVGAVAVPPQNNHDPLIGAVDLSLPSGDYRVSAWVMQLADSSGVLVNLDSVSVPRITSALHLSDLVIAPNASPAEWSSGSQTVPLNPLGTYAAGSTANAYFQLAGLVPGQPYQLRFELFRGDSVTAHAALAIAATYTAPDALAEVVRTLGLQSLQPGDYRVRVTVTGDSQSAQSLACLTVVKP